VSLKVENIKKLMGWCPNAKAHEAKRNVNFEDLDFDIPDGAREENVDLKNLGWLRKASNRTLLIYTFFTFVYFLVLNQIGINLIFLLAGSFSSLFLSIFFWKTQMQKYDDLVKHPVTEYSTKKKIITFAITFVVYLVISYLDATGSEFVVQAAISFVGGFLVSMWLEYLQILYWERKNHKMIYFDKSYGIWKKSYIIRERK